MVFDYPIAMIERVLKKKIWHSLQSFPVVAILGSRQVGKTTLAKQIQQEMTAESVYLDLELPSDLAKLSEAELFLGRLAEKTVIIDEIQRKPDLFSLIRALVDQKRRPGRFLVLGSASGDLLRQSAETLAGRIIFHELTPFTLQEVADLDDIAERLWIRGGYPDSFLAEDENISWIWRESFVKTFLQRDMPLLGIRVSPILIKRFWEMLAHVHGQLWNGSMIAKSLGVSNPTIAHYLDLLEQTFTIRRLPAYSANLKKRLVRSPKVYIRDTGILHLLLGIPHVENIYGHPVCGHSWEGFVIEQVIAQLPPAWEACFFRSAAGAEIDLVLHRGGKAEAAIEIKLSMSPRVDKGFWFALDDLELSRGFVIYPGKDTYPLHERLEVIPVSAIPRVMA